VAVGGQEANLSDDGRFVAKVELQEGENIILVEARNCAEWTRKKLTFNLISPDVAAVDDTGPLERGG